MDRVATSAASAGFSPIDEFFPRNTSYSETTENDLSPLVDFLLVTTYAIPYIAFHFSESNLIEAAFYFPLDCIAQKKAFLSCNHTSNSGQALDIFALIASSA